MSTASRWAARIGVALLALITTTFTTSSYSPIGVFCERADLECADPDYPLGVERSGLDGERRVERHREAIGLVVLRPFDLARDIRISGPSERGPRIHHRTGQALRFGTAAGKSVHRWRIERSEHEGQIDRVARTECATSRR